MSNEEVERFVPPTKAEIVGWLEDMALGKSESGASRIPARLNDRLDAAALIRKTGLPAPKPSAVADAYVNHTREWLASLSASMGPLGQRGVYCVTFDNRIHVKIGVSENIENRIASLQTGLPYKVEMLFMIPGGGREVEQAIHTFFTKFRGYGEWFRRSGEMALWVAQMQEKAHAGK